MVRGALWAVIVVAAAMGALAGCRAEPRAADPWSDAALLATAERFVHDTASRRAALEASLTSPDNQYSHHRLEAYARGTRGWDALPEWNPRSRVLTATLAAQVAAAARGSGALPEVPLTHPPLWDGVVPTTPATWVALGRRVFFEFPMRADVYLEHALGDPERAAAAGVERTADGGVLGLVSFRDVDGASRVGLTCAACHAAMRDGAAVAGQARRRFDYGRLRVAYFVATGEPVEPDQARRMAAWGPGRADVTEDDDEDPVAIPDLWGLRAQRYLTQAGTIRHDTPVALAIRQETQLIDANRQRIRPPRVLVWALTMYLYTLEPPGRGRPASSVAQGRALFAEHCASCHANAAYGGGLVAAERIGTHGALAAGRGRGTGHYRVPALLDVSRGAPYLHHGAVASLEDLLSAERLRGPAVARGHRAGTDLEAGDRAALIAFLRTL